MLGGIRPEPMRESVEIECPHCGEIFSLAIDVSEGSADFVADCEVCCRPIGISIHVRDGEVVGLEASPD